MKFHRDDVKKQGGHNHSSKKHMKHMAICCGIPILIILSLPLIARYSLGTSVTLAVIAPFICPIIMIPMMVMMLKGHKKSSCCDDKNKSQEINKPVE